MESVAAQIAQVHHRAWVPACALGGRPFQVLAQAKAPGLNSDWIRRARATWTLERQYIGNMDSDVGFLGASAVCTSDGMSGDGCLV